LVFKRSGFVAATADTELLLLRLRTLPTLISSQLISLLASSDMSCDESSLEASTDIGVLEGPTLRWSTCT
jgi:hypothetical protein